MNEREAKLSADIARTMHQALVCAFDMHAPFHDELEAACLALVEAADLAPEVKYQWAGDVRRQIKESTMLLMHQHYARYETAEHMCNHLLKLGYREIGNEACMEILDALCCKCQIQHDATRRLLHQSISMEVNRTLDQAMILTFTMSIDKAMTAFDDAEVSSLESLSSQGLPSETEQQWTLEIKRRVAQCKMKMLCDRDAPFQLVETLYSRIVRMGYWDLEEELDTGMYYARYCMRKQHKDISVGILDHLRVKLNDVQGSGSLDYSNCRHAVEHLLDCVRNEKS